MPGIIITPGTTNPPVTPVQLVAGYPFAKVPVRTIRKWQQFHPRWVGEAAPPPTLPRVNLRRDYFTGECEVRAIEVDPVSGATNIALSGTRYVPDGTYPATWDGSNYVFEIDPWSREPESIDLGEFSLPGYYVTEEEGSFGGLFVSLNFEVTLAAAGDGADYEIEVQRAGIGPVLGDAGSLEFGIATVVGPFDETVTIDMRLTRNGTECDRVFCALRFIGSITDYYDAGEVATIDESRTIIDAGYALPEVLYGDESIIPVITGPELPIVGYTRESISLGGIITPS